MHYKLYPDVIFLINFITDYCIICVWARLRKNTTTYIKIVLCSFLGALYAVIYTMDAIPEVLSFLMTYFGVPIFILKLMGLSFNRDGLYGFILLYGVSIVFGGLLALFGKFGIGVIQIVCVSAFMLQVSAPFAKIMTDHIQKRHLLYKTVLKSGDCIIELMGLYDTGNRLVDPYNGKVVHVVEKEKIRNIIANRNEPGIRYIPFKSVGTESGLMELIKISTMIVDTGIKQYEIKDSELALYEGNLSSDGSYEMILSAGIFK